MEKESLNLPFQQILFTVAFYFLLQNWLHRLLSLLMSISDFIFISSFSSFSVFDSKRRKFKLTSASFWGHVKLAYRIVSYRICCTVFRRQPVRRARAGGGSDEAPTNEAHSQLPNWFRLARYQPWSPLYTPPSASWHDRLSTHRPGGK